MITDFPNSPLPLPNPADLDDELAALGGAEIIPKALRRTLFPVITKEDVFNLMLAQRQAPEKVVADFAEAYRAYVGAGFALPTASAFILPDFTCGAAVCTGKNMRSIWPASRSVTAPAVPL